MQKVTFIDDMGSQSAAMAWIASWLDVYEGGIKRSMQSMIIQCRQLKSKKGLRAYMVPRKLKAHPSEPQRADLNVHVNLSAICYAYRPILIISVGVCGFN